MKYYLEPEERCYQIAYDMWAKVWSDTFDELHTSVGSWEPFHSDDFTRNTVGALFDGDKCAGLSLFRWVDLSKSYNRHDSYFRAWSESALEQLTRNGSEIYISSYFTVAPEYRKSDVKHELMKNIVRVFELSDADALTGTTRNDRKVDKLVSQYGFETLDVSRMHGVEVNLTALFRKDKS